MSRFQKSKAAKLSQIAVELIPDPEQGGFTARIPDIPAYGEGDTEEEAIADLKEALILYVEEVGVEETVASMLPVPTIHFVQWNLSELSDG